MPEEKWFVTTKKADFNHIAAEFGISPVLARIIRNRDIVTEEEVRYFLHGTLEDLHDPYLLKGMREGSAFLYAAIREKKQMRIIGDYDVDGFCSTYVLYHALQLLGASVSYRIPHRIKDGYGLNEEIIRECSGQQVEVIVTCDNGIAAAKEIALAKELGMEVLVTDHHEVPYREITGVDGMTEREEILPPSLVIDPKQKDCHYPYKGICGAVVAYKLVQVLLEQAEKEQFITVADRKDCLAELLEFAAMATICDVMDLLDENRIIVKYGLKQMEQSKNLGLRTLIEVCGLKGQKLGNYHVGFILGPCLNATGRLDSAARAMELFLCTELREAVVIATDLKALNESRKELTEQGVKEAVRQMEAGEHGTDKVMVIYLPDCHESIAGIIAGRIRERYYRPPFVLTRGEEGVKGSARSIEGYHIYEEMTKCSSFFTKYGGHKMAAGLSMREEDVEPFRQKINEICTLTEDDLQEKIHIDVPMPVSYVSFRLVEELELLEPFGTGNPKPVFAQKDLKFVSARALGKAGNVLRFTVEDSEQKRWEMMYFGGKDNFEAYAAEKYGQTALDGLYSGKGSPLYFDVVYYPGVNTWQGNTKLQLVMQQYR